ncbi:Clp protease N-terminal domain-containing protein [Streptomyces sp. NPDC055692]|uniref:Clp protease N-terminal domain-containing protein n=1 Tax=Streptomyces sp. NPDC055692 TaxID=3155683 RepID=UPI0034404005
MTMLTGFTQPARRVVVRAGVLAIDAGRDVLGTGHLLAALAEVDSTCLPLEALDLTPFAVLAEVEERGETDRRQPDGELLADLGIDLDEVRRRAFDATSLRSDDPVLWRLRRSRALPLRLTLTGPLGILRLNGQSRKVIEVAATTAHRRGDRTHIGCEDLLWGLLADSSNESVRILHRLGVDLRRFWTDLERWHAAA